MASRGNCTWSQRRHGILRFGQNTPENEAQEWEMRNNSDQASPTAPVAGSTSI